MQLYLIRHGEIAKKHLGRYIGITDIGLSHEGKKQAKKISDFFKNTCLDKIYVSHLKRAHQTAEPIAQFQKIVVTQDKRIAEIDLGPWEGKTSKQVKNMLPKDIACEQVTSGGELYKDFQKRVRSFLTDLLKTHAINTVVVITHKGVIREMYKHLLADKDLIVDQEYGAINHFVIEHGKVEEKTRNKTI